jgi:hypothetical protein
MPAERVRAFVPVLRPNAPALAHTRRARHPFAAIAIGLDGTAQRTGCTLLPVPALLGFQLEAVTG